MKVYIGAVGALILAGCVVAIGYLTLFAHHKELRHHNQAQLLKAIPVTATAELRHRGFTLSKPLRCWNMHEATPKKMRVACAGTTTKDEKVQVIGAAEAKVQEEYFTILIDGRPLVQNVACLGADCHPKD
ncbi:MAG: hypothetical protein QOE54_1973 [Streptosporangiaceae bacterium]|nr:hypothetical protein [Streptosporangiaceae bacterium]MDX6429607.1 hypothetical protein [Streptosporangiaceae bacterium]